MAQNYVSLTEAARIFRVHPRTILRAIAHEHNTYWHEDVNNQMVSIPNIAKAYNTTVQTIRAVLENRDTFLLPDEAAKALGIRPRTFRDRRIAGRYTKIGQGGIARYLHSKIISDLIASGGMD